MRKFMSGITALIALLLSVNAAMGQHPNRAQGVTLDPLYSLQSHQGAKFTADDIKGRPFIVVFGFTHCPNVCPTTLVEMGHLLTALKEGGDKIRVVFVTVDPERDTVDALKNYLSSFDPRIVGLTGAVIDVTAATATFNAFFEKVASGDDYTIDHTLKIFFIDKYGLLAKAQPSGASLNENLALARKLLNQ
jgi:protein SCO1